MAVGFFGLFTLLLVALKLLGITSIGWGVIILIWFIPTIIYFVIFLVIVGLIAAAGSVRR